MNISYRRKQILVISVLMSLGFCLLLFRSSMFEADDALFHLNRIGSLSQAMQNGTLYPYVFSNQNFGHGYGSSMFYCNLFLYPAAILNILGLSLVTSYKVLLFLCTLVTCFTVSYLIREFTDRISVISVGMFLFLFAGYRITDVYTRAALGEILAFAFIPVVLLGIYRIFYKEKPDWLILALGFTAVFLSHNLTFVLCCILFALFFLINIRKMITDKKRMILMILGILTAIGLSAFYMFPMMEQFDSVVISARQSLAYEVINLKDLIGIPDGRYVFSPGLALMIIPFFNLKKVKEDTFSFHCLILAVASVVFIMIPWIWSFTLFDFIQFPWRILLISTALFIPPFIQVWDGLSKPLKAGILVVHVLFILVSFWNISQFSVLNPHDDESLKEDDRVFTMRDPSFQYCLSELSMAEYLINKDYDYRYTKRKIHTNPVSDDEIEFKEEKGRITFITHTSDVDMTYIMPLTYYKGYSMTINGKKLYAYPDDINHFATFVVPASDSGAVATVQYTGTAIQKGSWIITGLTVLSLCLYGIIKNKRMSVH